MKEHDVSLSELDYEQLPPALRRKYFSSLERLRLAQDGVYPIYSSRSPRESQRPLTSSNASSFSTRRSVRRPSVGLEEYLLTSSSSSSTRHKLRKQSRTNPISHQDVAHFASLPAVLQRKYFSREEQVLLAGRINHIILDAADEVLYKQYTSKPQASVNCRELFLNSSGLLDPDSDDDDSNSNSNRDADDMELSEDDMRSLQWLDEEEDLDLSLYDYHAAVAETTRKSHSAMQRTSLRRGLMISGVPFSRRSSSINSTGVQSPWPLSPTMAHTSSRTSRSPQTAVSVNHRKNRASTSSLDPAATHYQDPAARMKLRVYLASPQKFDEAIEFGFPSMQEPGATRSLRAPLPTTTTPRQTELNAQSSSPDDTPSLSDGDDQEIDVLDSPRTPEMSTYSSASSKSKDGSLDRTSIKPKVVRDFIDPYVHALASNREMTLHMTLTRPDLRSPDDMSATGDINARPLEQAPLHFSDDVASFWDNLPDNENKMKKLFRKLKLRP